MPQGFEQRYEVGRFTCECHKVETCGGLIVVILHIYVDQLHVVALKTCAVVGYVGHYGIDAQAYYTGFAT